jgi:hypothetical protein
MEIAKSYARFLFATLLLSQYALGQVDSAIPFYPLNVGDTWQFCSTHIDRLNGGPINETVNYFTLEISGDTLLGNGRTYFTFKASDNNTRYPAFQRIDSLTGQVFAFDTSAVGNERQIDSLLAPEMSAFSGCRLFDLPGTFIWRIDTEACLGLRLPCRRYATPAGITESIPDIEYTLAKGLGLSFCNFGTTGFDETLGSSTTDTLVYAKINGKEYGTLVLVRQFPVTPQVFELRQNYPNPFNPSTIIEYVLPSSEFVILRIFDVLGREVAQPIFEWQDEGPHHFTFNGKRLTSGVYFYRLKAGPNEALKKLILTK